MQIVIKIPNEVYEKIKHRRRVNQYDIDDIRQSVFDGTPLPEWIPISERLPEDNIHVLCQFNLNGMAECYLAHGVFHIVGGVVMSCNEVLAWMPLPKPYEAEGSDKE